MNCRTTLIAATFLSILSGAAFADNQPGFDLVEPLPRNLNITQIVGAGDVLVASGMMTRLSNGTWVDNCKSLGVFDYEGGKFHGWRRNENFKFVLQTSLDGVTWTDVGSGKEFDGISTAAYDNGKYLVVYQTFNRDQIIVSNDNGMTWTETNDITKPAGINGGRFVSGYGFGRWYIRGGSSTTNGFLTSTNGTAWSAVTVPVGTPVGGFVDSAMAFGGGVGLVSVSNALLKTTDGTTWTEAKRFSNGLQVNGMAYNGGTFLLGRTDFSGKFFLESSTDLGVTFNIIPNVHLNRLAFIQDLRQVKAVTAWKTGFAVAGENGFVLGTENVSLGEPSFQRLTDASLYHFNSYPYQLVVNGGTIMRYFTGGTPRSVQTSVDGGFTWSAPVTNLVGAKTDPELLALGGKYFLRDTRGTSVSNDAVTWVKAQSTDKNPDQFNADLWCHSMIFDGTKYVAIIEEFMGTAFKRFLSTSTDGVSWAKTGTVPVPSATTGNERLIYVGGEYFYLSYDFSSTSRVSIHRSKNLTNWSLLIPSYNGSVTKTISIYENGGRWLITGAGAAKVSDDGVTFYDLPSGTLYPITNLIRFNGKFYGSGNDGPLVSDDLHFWKKASGSSSFQTFITGNANGILVGNSGFEGPKYFTNLPVALPPTIYTGPEMAISQGSGGNLKISVPTEEGKFYYIEVNPKLNLPLWKFDFANFQTITGDGTVKEIEFAPSGTSGFFRLQVF